jgi:hypothetical protein
MLAAKTLTSVEVDPSSSHQHELHAGKIRTLLEFGGRTTGSLTTHFYLADGSEPVVDEGTFTLYDAREANPQRSEWHLYYRSSEIPALARAGDLLVLLRPDKSKPDLHGLIARPGTRYERQLRAALDLGDAAAIRQFAGIETHRATLRESAQIALPLVAHDVAFDVTDHPVYLEALRTGRMPKSKTMAGAAYDLVHARAPRLDPDAYLTSALDTESELFFAIEAALGQQELNAMTARGANLEEVLAFAMSKHQARKARRGLSLQNHLEVLLDRSGIPNSPQCTTEPGETPDFIIPGCREYHDPDFPAERLFMVGCKSKLRDRWRQHLNEARRIPIKFHVSLDADLSDDLMERMHEGGLRLFLPRSLIEAHYAGRAVVRHLSTISDLIETLARR